MSPVIRLNSLTLKPHGHGETFQAEMASLAVPCASRE